MMKSARKTQALATSIVVTTVLATLIPVTIRERNRSQALAIASEAAQAYSAGQIAASESEWLNALRLDSSDARIYSELGDFYENTGQPETAGVCYLKAIDLDPKYPHVYCRLALSAWKAGSPIDALNYASRELKQAPDCAEAKTVLSALGGAKEAAIAGVRLNPPSLIAADDEKIAADCAELFLAHEPERAIRLLLREVRRFPNSGRIASLLGQAYARRAADSDTVQNAIRWLRRAEELRPGDEDAHLKLGQLYLQLGRLSEALAEARSSLALRPKDVEAAYLAWQARRQLGDGSGAAVSEQQYLTLKREAETKRQLVNRFHLHPEDLTVAHQLVLAHLAAGDNYPAMEVARFEARIHPSDPGALADLRRTESISRSDEE